MFETAWNWYRNPAYVEALADIYGADEAHGIKRIDVPEALLYGPDRLPENPPRLSTSSFLPDTLLAVLRTPQADWNAVLLCDKGGVIGHRHPAALGFQLFANGEEAFPGTGTPLYSHPTYTKWYAQTISHSTVALNTRSQIAPTTNQRMDFALSQWGVSAVEMSVEGVQRPNVTDECPARLRRTLAMTPRGIVDIFRVEKDEARLKNVKDPLPVNLLDWFLQIDGTLTLDNALAPSTDALIPKERAATPFGYDYLHDLQSVTGPGVVHGQLAQPKGGRVDLWLAPSSPDGKVYVAKRPGHDDSLDKELTALIQRRSANETAFAGFYAPCKDQAQVQSVRFPELSEDGGEVAMEISHKDGQDLVLSRAQPGTLAAEGATLDGTLGCEITLPGADRQFILVGTAWKHGETELSLKEAGSVIVDLSAGKTRIYNASDKPVEGSFRTSASAPAKTFSLQGGGKQD